MARRIKEVNGIKVIHRYSAGSIFSGLICLALAIVPILLLVMPWATFTDASDTTKVYSMTIVDIMKGLTGSVSLYQTQVFDVLKASDSIFSLLERAFTLGVFIIWVIIAIFDLLLVFFGLEYLFRGKVNHYKVPLNLSVFPMIFSIISLGLAITIQALFKIKNTGFDVNIFLNYVNLIITVLGLIVLSIIYVSSFKDRVFIGDLGDLNQGSGTREEREKLQHKYITNEITKVRYEPAIGLPTTLSSIGGHAFAENMNLVIAMIPNGIKTLGQSAFCNCGKLKIVSIPTSVKSIGFNCFFNCANLKRINYAGTKEQWRHVKRGSNWLTKAGTYTVVCIDGAIIVNPYH